MRRIFPHIEKHFLVQITQLKPRKEQKASEKERVCVFNQSGTSPLLTWTERLLIGEEAITLKAT